MLQERSLMGGVSKVKTAIFKVDLFITEAQCGLFVADDHCGRTGALGAGGGSSMPLHPHPNPRPPPPLTRLIELPK